MKSSSIRLFVAFSALFLVILNAWIAEFTSDVEKGRRAQEFDPVEAKLSAFRQGTKESGKAQIEKVEIDQSSVAGKNLSRYVGGGDDRQQLRENDAEKETNEQTQGMDGEVTERQESEMDSSPKKDNQRNAEVIPGAGETAADNNTQSSNTVDHNPFQSDANSSTGTEDKNRFDLSQGSFRPGVFCQGCWSAMISRRVGPCSSRIARHVQSSNMTLREAAEYVAKKEHPEECHMCSVDHCSNEKKMFWRFDAAAPPILKGRTLFLEESIPDTHRLPKTALSNLTHFFANRSNVFPQRQYFFEYNPSIVRLPKAQTPHITGETPVYLASFRVSNMQQCVTGDDELQMIGGSWPRPRQKDYLGLALLRSDLSIIQESVFDFPMATEDFRLFSLRDQLYVGSFNMMVPIWLDANQATTKDVEVLQDLFPSQRSFRTGLVVRKTKSCSNDFGGKNFNYFVDEKNQTILESKPMAKRETFDLEAECKGRKDTPPPDQSWEAKVPDATFPTVEELHFAQELVTNPSLTAERGSACCAPIQDRNGNDLLLGISHSKTRFRGAESRDNLKGGVAANSFFSTFYAFERSVPFRVVARSGKFCLGFPEVNETASNPFARSNMKRLEIGESFDCPKIHFVSGMVEKADDPSSVIIAYGVNDCSPRFVEVAKESIVRMLFPEGSGFSEIM